MDRPGSDYIYDGVGDGDGEIDLCVGHKLCHKLYLYVSKFQVR
jgi:hypothetical protein